MCPVGGFCEGERTWLEVIAKMGWWRNPLLLRMKNAKNRTNTSTGITSIASTTASSDEETASSSLWWISEDRSYPPLNLDISNYFAPCLFPPACQGAINLEEFEGKYEDPMYNLSTSNTKILLVDPSASTRKEECDPRPYVPGGRLCGTCQPNYIMDEGKGMICTKCPSPNANIALFSLGVFLSGVLVTVLLALRIRSHGHKHLSGVLKRVILNYLQVSSLALKFNLVWPDSMQSLLSSQGSIATVSSTLVNPDCLLRGHYTNQTMAQFDLEHGKFWTQFDVLTLRQVINICLPFLLPR
jgi:hypothetical protein